MTRPSPWLPRSSCAPAIAAFALLGPCGALPAAAHVGSAPPGFGSGSVGVLFEAGHLLPVVAAGLLLAQWLVQRSAAAGPLLAFAAGAAFGLAAIASGWAEFDLVPWPSLAIALAGGLLVAWARPWPQPAMLVATFALGLGFGLAALVPAALQAPGHVSAWPWLLGLWSGACAWLLIVAWAVHAVLHRARAAWARIGVRIVGSWIAASSAIVLALALAPLPK